MLVTKKDLESLGLKNVVSINAPICVINGGVANIVELNFAALEDIMFCRWFQDQKQMGDFGVAIINECGEEFTSNEEYVLRIFSFNNWNQNFVVDEESNVLRKAFDLNTSWMNKVSNVANKFKKFEVVFEAYACNNFCMPVTVEKNDNGENKYIYHFDVNAVSEAEAETVLKDMLEQEGKTFNKIISCQQKKEEAPSEETLTEEQNLTSV